jgi:3-oxoacyl-[acyl-carrier-protein] synthase-3
VSRRAAITSTGRHFPAKVVPNRWFYEDLGLQTNEEWMKDRTGILERRFADPARGETTASMATEAARVCLARAGLAPTDVDCILLATITPDMPLPATACLVQTALGAENAWAADTLAACSGFVYALAQARGLVCSGMARRVLVIGAETMTSILDFRDRNTCIIFGDGAGAVLVEALEEGERRGGEIGDFCLHSDGNGAELLMIPAGGVRSPPTHETIDARLHYVHQEGRQVFKHAVTRMSETILELLQRNGLRAEDVDLVVPHQANIRIIEACRTKLGLPPEKVVITVDRYANTTAATIPTSLDIAIEDGRIRPGSKVVLATFGAGFTWGTALLQY